MSNTPYGDKVRIRTVYVDTLKQDYEVVEELVGPIWIERRRFGHMSSDFAVTNAANLARELARKHIGGH